MARGYDFYLILLLEGVLDFAQYQEPLDTIFPYRWEGI